MPKENTFGTAHLDTNSPNLLGQDLQTPRVQNFHSTRLGMTCNTRQTGCQQLEMVMIFDRPTPQGVHNDFNTLG